MTGDVPEKKTLLVSGEDLPRADLNPVAQNGLLPLVAPIEEIEVPRELRGHLCGMGAEKKGQIAFSGPDTSQRPPRPPKKIGAPRLKLPAKNKTPFFGF